MRHCWICQREFKASKYGGPKYTCSSICARVWTYLPFNVKDQIKSYHYNSDMYELYKDDKDNDIKKNDDGSFTDYKGIIYSPPDYKYLKERLDMHVLKKNLLGLISDKELKLKYGLSHNFCNPSQYKITKIRMS